MVFCLFSGSFHDPHLAGVHLVSKLGSWDNGRSSPKEISGWLLCINWLKLWFFNNPKTWSSRANKFVSSFPSKNSLYKKTSSCCISLKKIWLPLTISKQNLWWLSPEFASSEDRLYQRNAFTGQLLHHFTCSLCCYYQYWEEALMSEASSITSSATLCPGGSGLVTILDEMFGTEGTMDFLKDNFFEVNLIWHSVMIFVNIISTTIRSKMFELDIFNENAI